MATQAISASFDRRRQRWQDLPMHIRLHFGHLVKAMRSGRVVSDPDLLVADSGLPCDTFNAVACAQLRPDSIDARIKSVIQSFERRPFSWWLGPEDRPGNLSARLEAAGLSDVEVETAMRLDLTERTPSVAPTTGFCIRRVTTPAELAHFAAIIAANWSPPDEHVTRFYEQTAAFALQSDCPLRLFLGYSEGEPVATCELTIAPDGVAGLYSVATLAAFRGRGFASAMTSHALAVGCDLGMREAALHASSKGLGIYERLGFRRVGEFHEFKRSSWTDAVCLGGRCSP
jgi:ribosomal protein S18 acetylase RimI-like enzyme